MRLEAFFRAVKPYLAGEATLAAATRALGEVDPKGLAIYGRFCENHRREILENIYPHCRAALGRRWKGEIARFFRAHPAGDWELNGNAGPFVEHARQLTPKWLADLADLEWWELAVAVAPSRPEPAPRGARLAVAAGVALRAYSYDVVKHADAKSGRRRPPQKRDNLVVFWREPVHLRTRRDEATPLELVAIKAAYEGVSIAEAARAGGIPAPLLEQTVEDLVAAGILRRVGRAGSSK